MTTATDRQQYRELVAQVAAKARAILPQAVNGRLEGAVKLVLAGDVEPLDDGSIQVGSCTDPTRYYRLEGQACTCTDFVQGKAPEGWCRHRIAAGIDKRVRELLAATHTPTQTSAQPLPEAPASCNVSLSIGGHKVQVTLRDTDEQRMLERLQSLLDRYPTPPSAPSPQGQGEGWCSKHDVQMHQNHKNGRSWWSHKTAEGWCQGKLCRESGK
jgi:hypothetical protein